MTIKDIQEQLAHRLNSVEELIQGGCKAFAEDNRDVYDKAAEFVNGGGVAIVVVTPELARAADGDAEGMIPFEGDIVIQCIEKAPLTSGTATLRALDAAETVVIQFDSAPRAAQNSQLAPPSSPRLPPRPNPSKSTIFHPLSTLISFSQPSLGYSFWKPRFRVN